MKVGTITTPNIKGQIVIPKEVRDTLGIRAGTPLNIVVRGGGAYLYPIDEVITKIETNNSYLDILEKTRGILSGPFYKNEKAKRKLELEASKSRKKKW